jgi:hypothetical protein
MIREVDSRRISAWLCAVRALVTTTSSGSSICATVAGIRTTPRKTQCNGCGRTH